MGSDRSMRARLDGAAWEAALEEGWQVTPEEAVEYALSAEESALAAPPPATRVTGPETPPAAWPDALTRRQKEVAYLVARGLSNRQISSELAISERTAETHISKILKRLGLASRTQLATRVIQRWPPPSDPS